METSVALLISTTCQRAGLGLYIFALLASSFMGVNIPMNLVALVALATLAVGGLASAFHLSTPTRFFNAFSNFKSHLTQEAIITPFLGIALLVAGLNGYVYNIGAVGTFFEWLALLFAVAFLVSTGLVYQLNARPAWDTSLVLIIFLTTSAQIGTLFTSAIASSLGASITNSFMVTTVLMYVLCIVTQYLYTQRLKGLGYGVAVEVAKKPYKGPFASWVIFGVIASATFYAVFAVYASPVAIWLAVISSAIGILSWTVLFYRCALLVKKFPMYSVDLNVYI